MKAPTAGGHTAEGGAPTRDELIALCTDGVVPVEKWSNRDSADAQRQLGEARALLAAGCNFKVADSPESTDQTWWIDTTFPGFGHFDWGGVFDEETFYIPRRARLDSADGRDWY